MNRTSFRFSGINSLKIFASTVREMEILINLSNCVYSRLSAFFGTRLWSLQNVHS